MGIWSLFCRAFVGFSPFLHAPNRKGTWCLIEAHDMMKGLRMEEVKECERLQVPKLKMVSRGWVR